jgi:hypothetical protein
MNAAPPVKARRFIQIHLSTAVLLMIVTSGLLWANLSIRVTRDPVSEILGSGSNAADMRIVESGWPMSFRRQHMEILSNSILIHEANVSLQEANPGTTTTVSLVEDVGVGLTHDPLIRYESLAFNVAVGVVLLLAVAFAAEKLIRRRERSRLPEEPR